MIRHTTENNLKGLFFVVFLLRFISFSGVRRKWPERGCVVTVAALSLVAKRSPFLAGY